MSHRLLIALVLLLPLGVAHSDAIRQTKGDFYDAFRQLGVDLPTANVYRTASGAPGREYWQQRADYRIDVALDEKARRITGVVEITYHNNSPDRLRYLWLQLDQNRFARDSLEARSKTAADAAGRNTWRDAQGEGKDVLSYKAIAQHQNRQDVEYGFELGAVTDGTGNALAHTVVDTMMRVDLPTPLASGERTVLRIEFAFNVLLEILNDSRGGYEHFPETDTALYFLAQWYPRVAAYTDYAGWQHKQFLGRGEFTLEFGDFEVAITVPANHIVSSTGELQNPDEVLSATQRERLAKARTSEAEPVFIVTPEEALANEKTRSAKTKTWVFQAESVRDFAWSSSSKYVWDAMSHRQPGATYDNVLAMSFYPNEAGRIWADYSTHAVKHTMEVYSRFSFDYPYPSAQSVNTWKSGGMEYPMITFNGYREDEVDADPEDLVDDARKSTYSRKTKYGLIGVIIHEIGHIYFPMTVNSDERQWTWMDEGINSFLDYMAAWEWEENYPAYRPNHVNVLDYVTDYMTSEDQVPIMTNSDSVLHLGPNAYTKPTAALVVLRETVMGRKLFDFAFKEYSRRWRFKRPTPADFFRTMEDASGVDLDWFWRGWFYSTDHVDVAIRDVREYQISSTNPDMEGPLARAEREREVPEALGQRRNREEGRATYLQRHPELADFYNENDEFTPTNKARNDHADLLDGLEDWEYEALRRAVAEGQFIYFVDFDNLGGLPTPLPLEITNADGTSESLMLPAEIWRRDIASVTKLLIREQAISAVALDPQHQTADADFANNHFPRRIERSRIELYKSENDTRDLMRETLDKLRERKAGEDGKVRTVPLTGAP
ncbi:MAG: M1 family metallopeptidase [Pseudomonadota bacterium]